MSTRRAVRACRAGMLAIALLGATAAATRPHPAWRYALDVISPSTREHAATRRLFLEPFPNLATCDRERRRLASQRVGAACRGSLTLAWGETEDRILADDFSAANLVRRWTCRRARADSAGGSAESWSALGISKTPF